MYRCHDIELPRLFIADISDLELGLLDPNIQPGFECFFSPYLDADKFSMRRVVNTLVQHDCAHIATPLGVMKERAREKPLYTGSFTRELVCEYPLKHAAEKTVGAMERDLVFACEDVKAEHSSETELFEWIYSEHHPYGKEVIETATRAFGTPLGNVTVRGPEGPAPFKVTKLLNRHYPHGETRTVGIVDDLYELSITLDDLTDNAEYRVGCEGRQLLFRASDEATECFTCVAEGLAFGIGVYMPSDHWNYEPGDDPSFIEGYYVSTDHSWEPSKAPICIEPAPYNRDRVKKAILWVGWLENWEEERGPWVDAGELLSYFLT